MTSGKMALWRRMMLALHTSSSAERSSSLPIEAESGHEDLAILQAHGSPQLVVAPAERVLLRPLVPPGVSGEQGTAQIVR